MSLLNFNFVIIYIIHKMLILLKNHLKDNIFQSFFKKYNRLLFFLKNLTLFITYNDERSKA